MITRPEEPHDIDAIHALNELAFGRPLEANIADKLRIACGDNLLSLVAVENEKIVGHILFSPAVIEGLLVVIKGMGLAPMSVMPDMQRQGIGTQLVRAGITHLKETKCPFVIVLGHPGYYPRFGFKKASLYGIKCQWENVPDEAFMILWLNKPAILPGTGLARYREEFSEAV